MLYFGLYQTLRLLRQPLLGLIAMGLALHVMAQPVPSADAAVAAAQKWLTLADQQQTSTMWEASAALMQKTISRDAWAEHLNKRKNIIPVASAARVWTHIEHQVNHPQLPAGEFASVRFASSPSNIAVWEQVSLVWSEGKWIPVGYQFGRTTPPNAVPSSRLP